MAFDIGELVKKAVKEMKEDCSWKGYEERINTSTFSGYI
jgi:hypothetical protein